MPVFLERHDFFKITAADIVKIHQEDLRIQHRYHCCVLAYWFDKKRKITFCLIDAPDLKSVKQMHCHIHHSYPCQIFQVEDNIIEVFLNCLKSEKYRVRKYTQQSHYFHTSLLCAVMVMKIYYRDSNISQRYMNREKRINEEKISLQKLIIRNKGRLIRSDCEGYIFVFDSISQSIKSALQFQKELEVQRRVKGENKIVSIGIHAGIPNNEQCNPFEETTNLARRLCCIAGHNQIVVSSRVKEQFQPEDFGNLMKNSNLKSLTCRDELFLTRLMNIIEPHYRENLKIGDLCQIIGESRSQLYRKILDVTNRAPVELINEFRLKKAIELMDLQNGHNISQIAFEAGFNSLSYFSRRFKKRFGHLPSAYMSHSNKKMKD